MEKTPDQNEDHNISDCYSDEEYFREYVGTQSKEIPGYGRTGDYQELYMNTKHHREYKGALTNVASFDNQDLNIVSYTDKGQLSSKAPKLL